MMTNQEAFDLVAEKLSAQGRPSVKKHSIGTECRYRGPDGLRCAAGWLIPDEKYNTNMEGKPADDSMFSGIIYCSHSLARDLQTAHDAGSEKPAAEWLVHWRTEMRKIAARHSLTIPACLN